MPDDADAHLLLAQCLLDQGEVSAAHQAAATAVGLAPLHAHAHYVLSLAWQQLSRETLPDALTAIREAIRLDPGQPDTYAIESSVLCQQHQPAALAAAEAGLALDPAHADCLSELSHDGEARTAYERLLQVAPNDVKGHNNLGLTLLKQDRDAEALAHYREALRLDPTFDAAHAGLAEALLRRYPSYQRERRVRDWFENRLLPRPQGPGGPRRWSLLLLAPLLLALRLPTFLRMRHDPDLHSYRRGMERQLFGTGAGVLAAGALAVAALLVPPTPWAAALLGGRALSLPLVDWCRPGAQRAAGQAWALLEAIFLVGPALLAWQPWQAHEGRGRLLLLSAALATLLYPFARHRGSTST